VYREMTPFWRLWKDIFAHAHRIAVMFDSIYRNDKRMQTTLAYRLSSRVMQPARRLVP